MTKVTFELDVGKDLFNLWQTTHSRHYGMDFTKYLPKDIVEYCKDKDFKSCRSFLKRGHQKIYDSGFIQLHSSTLQKAWNKIGPEYFRRLKRVTGKPLDIKLIQGYATTAGRCPYDPHANTFMFSAFSGIPDGLLTAGHEIFHLHFHKYNFKDIEAEIGYDKTHDLKEALTVLLNIEFRDLWFMTDHGYDPHKELRKFIASTWNKNNDYDGLLHECVLYIKKRRSHVK